MDVGIVTTSYPRHDGDYAGIAIHRLVLALRDLGHRVRVVAPECPDSPARSQRADGVVAAPIRPRFARRICYGSGIVENVRRNPLLITGLPGLLRSLTDAVRRDLADCDVIDACFTPAGIATARARRPDQATVYSGHGSDVHLAGKSKLYARYFGRLLSRFDAVTVVSQQLATTLSASGCYDDASVVTTGAPADALATTFSKFTRPTVVFAGRLIPLKRPLELIQSWSLVTKVIPEARLIVLGDGPLLAPAKALATELNIAQTVQFRGRVVLDTVWRTMGQAWLTVLPSTVEGFPSVLIESLAAGTPFVASPAGDAPEIAERTGGGVIVPEPVTPDRLAQAVIGLLDDRGRLAAMAEAGRDGVAGAYSWQAVARQKVAVYEDALAKVRKDRDRASAATSIRRGAATVQETA